MSPRQMSAGVAAAKAKAADGRRQHQEWLDLTEVSGPFLTMPVLLRAWPQLDTLEKDERARIRARHADWQTDTTAGRDEWVVYVLGRLLGWDDALTFRQGESEHDGLDRLTLRVAEHNTEVRPDFALVEPGTDLAIEPDAQSAAKRVRLLGMTVPSGTAPTARVGGGGDWSAAPADRLARLLRHHGVPLGLVTDGRWWCLVWAPLGGVTTTAVFDAIGWNEAAERNVVRAFVSLLRRRRFFEYDDAETLVGLLKASLAAGEDVTEAMGVQVRQAVELLVDAIGRADVRAIEHGAPGLHASGVGAGEVYRGAVAVMMRIVFLLFAEERGLLPADNEVYARSYSARFLRDELKARADDEGETSLEHTTSAWHRLIALFHAVHGGVDHPGSGFHLPAYDGSIFDPDKYPWLERTTPLLAIDDRTVLHMLQAVQEVRVGKGKDREVRTLSFRALDVEQIGYVYEGLLSFDGRRAVEHMVGLIGPEGLEHEVPLRELESLAAKAGGSLSALAKSIHEKWKDPKPPATAGQLEKKLASLGTEAAAEARRRLNAVTKDVALTERLLPFVGILRDDLRSLPTVIPNGALYVTESSLRKNTGTHYTPRFLAEEVVLHALEPLVYEPGPLQTADTGEWRLKSAEQILDLKVADIAMGSAAFLVAACRYLGDRLIEAWESEGRADAMAYRAGRAVDAVTSADAEQDPVVVEARRQIIEHCLYGVDINPMAVEMAKLSLWLVSMDPGRPFTFLDDRLVAGDSLLGVHTMEQIQSVHMKPSGQTDVLAEQARQLVDQLTRERLAITAIKGVDLPALQEKRERLEEVNRHSRRLRLVGDLIAGAAIATCASGRVPWYEEGGGERVRDLFPKAAWIVQRIMEDGVEDDSEVVREARATAEGWLGAELPEGALERRPVHWPLVFPEVFSTRGGFDAIVGNPPFLGGKKITPALGQVYREYLVEYTADGARGNADLVSYFVLQFNNLLREEGQAGLVATNTLAQGDSREVGLDQIVAAGVVIRRAVKSEPWPSKSATLEYCAVWVSGERLGVRADRILDGLRVPGGISTSLNPMTRESSWVEPLKVNRGIAFIGSYVLGLGFTLSEECARQWIEADARYCEVLEPYLNGYSVNSSPRHQADRWIINFREMSEDRAREYELAYRQVSERVRPERQAKDPVKYPRMVNEWWKYWNARPGLYGAISSLSRCIVITLHAHAVMPALVSNGQVFTHALAVFASGDPGMLALLSSAPHYWWALDRGSTMKGDLRYTPTDVFETLVRPSLTDRLRDAGGALNARRSEIMESRGMGLTATYHLVHDPECQETDIIELRRLHDEVDRATIEAYGWHDILDETGGTVSAGSGHVAQPLDHGFHETDQGTRYTIGLLARTEIIDRLRQLNHQAYADEVHLGLHKGVTEKKAREKHPDLPPPSPEAIRKRKEQLAARGGLDFGEGAEGALF
ncbi:Eco57I restriction-modification methylase domain-containing protein [Streptomyces antibioticus]|uniref:Eco57I restriction-modification methylase domain-containing protein n=1 Tax=Streptomyces antibioticus TaxID=1890 RepID=UPI0022543D58|nr:DNA methyltransferase [Streptomyces antibioticus]MCX4741806.1 BREX-1 system adenine-specific DNA-methyltransferase PglX [Streptomyces antibioticus]